MKMYRVYKEGIYTECDELNLKFYEERGYKLVSEISENSLDSEQIELLAKLKADELVEEEKQKLMSRIFELRELKKDKQLELLVELGHDFGDVVPDRTTEEYRIEAILKLEKGN